MAYVQSVCVRCWLMYGSSVNDLIMLKPVLLFVVKSSDSVARQDMPSPKHMHTDAITLTYTSFKISVLQIFF